MLISKWIKYTEIIITVIAVALVKIAFQDTQAIKPLFAHNGANNIHKIAICGYDGCANIINGKLMIHNVGR